MKEDLKKNEEDLKSFVGTVKRVSIPCSSYRRLKVHNHPLHGDECSCTVTEGCACICSPVLQ